MIAARTLVLSGYGLNCEEETKFAFELGGGQADIIHVNDLIAAPELLEKYQILALPGGFSYGDDTGSGNAFANKLRHHLGDALHAFVARETLVIGICNGFQIIANLGLVPAMHQDYTRPAVALTTNDSSQYLDRWVDLKIAGKSPWFEGIEKLSLPIAHGEGKLFADKSVLAELVKNRQVALQYESGEICEYLDLPANPNGSVDDIAAITDTSGRILGMMPHPERAVTFTQLPHWPLAADQLRRNKKPLPQQGPGLALFKNAAGWFK